MYSHSNLNLSGRDIGQTIRLPSTALLVIDSEDRFKDYPAKRASIPGGYNYSPYNFVIQKNETLMNGFLYRVGVSEVVFPWSIPNINNKTDSIIVHYSGGSSPAGYAIVSLTNGFYKPSEIASNLQAQIRSATGNSLFTMIYGGTPTPYGVGTLPVFEYNTHDSGILISFSPLPYNTTSASSPTPYPYGPQTKQLFDLLGFTSLNSVPSSTGSGRNTLCQAIRYVDICSAQITNNQSLKDQMSQTIARDTLCRVYLGDGAGDSQSIISPSDPNFCPPGCAPFVIYRNFTNPKNIQWLPNQGVPGFLSFQVYDDTGDLLEHTEVVSNTPNSSYTEYMDWSMTMLCSEN